MIDVNILENGDARLTLGNADKSQLAEWLRDGQRDHAAIWADLFEQHSCNGSYTSVYDYGLTDAPAFASYVDHNDEGDCIIPDDADLWFFGDYCIRDELAELAQKGYVIFTRFRH